MTLVCDDWSS